MLNLSKHGRIEMDTPAAKRIFAATACGGTVIGIEITRPEPARCSTP